MRGGLYGRIDKYVMDGKGIWMKGGKDKKSAQFRQEIE